MSLTCLRSQWLGIRSINDFSRHFCCIRCSMSNGKESLDWTQFDSNHRDQTVGERIEWAHKKLAKIEKDIGLRVMRRRQLYYSKASQAMVGSSRALRHSPPRRNVRQLLGSRTCYRINRILLVLLKPHHHWPVFAHASSFASENFQVRHNLARAG
jgi:hypothetical protein